MLSNVSVNTLFKFFFHSSNPVFMRVGGIRHPICRTKSVVKLYEHSYNGIIQHRHGTQHNSIVNLGKDLIIIYYVTTREFDKMQRNVAKCSLKTPYSTRYASRPHGLGQKVPEMAECSRNVSKPRRLM